MSSSDHQSPETHHGGDLVEQVADHFVDREECLGARLVDGVHVAGVDDGQVAQVPRQQLLQRVRQVERRVQRPAHTIIALTN